MEQSHAATHQLIEYTATTIFWTTLQQQQQQQL